ncbi:hypothetical protein SAMN05444003_0235 [Cognatiyoonia sediminum]|uniref:Uncharacterized protein n=1 Tax=Cognatiyoonia sediminum TaxID=1508389 RepID=A0A1M5LDQ6_9RHOB|nr:hypothetical protein [Cognatiyoonia sediminum]SHG63158.1 hypothetical protein SAMN05444003_0235 [Cognatiyoonia sediminum]
MQYLIWIGTVISVIGLAGIIMSIVRVSKAKKANLSDEDMRERISKILPLNLGSLFLSVIGLMMVILGISFS